LEESPGSTDERKLWLFAFLVLLLVSLWMLTMRLLNSAFLALDFEASLIYLPTILAGLIALYLSLKTKASQQT
jgi:TRAP-type C4-dicarboxylate transport system permease small subunit